MEAYTDLLQFCGDEGGWQGAVGTSGAFNYWAAVVSIRQGAVGTSGAFSYWATVVSIKALSHGVCLGTERVELPQEETPSSKKLGFKHLESRFYRTPYTVNPHRFSTHMRNLKRKIIMMRRCYTARYEL